MHCSGCGASAESSSNGFIGSSFVFFFSIGFSASPSTQFPRFSQLGPLRRSGRTRTPSLCSTTTPSGASVPQGHLLFGAPLRLRGRLGVFRRREGHLLAAHLGPSLRPRLVLRLSSFTRRFLIPRFAACGPSSGVVHSPFFFGYVFFFCGPLFAR